MPLTSDQVCSWAPPFVPVASSCRTRMGSPAPRGGGEGAPDPVGEAAGGEAAPPPDLEAPELQATPVALGGLELGESMHEAPAAGSALGGREEPFGAPTGLVEVDEDLDRLRGRIDDMELVRPGGLGAPDLAPDLVARLLVEGVEVGLPIALRRERQDRADLLQLTGDRPTLAGGAGIERGLERGQSRGVGAQQAQVHHVPALGAVGGG